MKVLIETVPHESHRYCTVGDYFDVDGAEHVLVSDMGNKKFERLVVLHELIEKWLTEERGISEESITTFDVEYERNRPEGDVSEPGDDPSSPYFNEHQFATKIERMLAQELHVDWDEYNATVENL